MPKHQYLFEQSNVQAICADRELATPEAHVTNDFYGQASVIKRFAGIDEESSLPVVLEHGINLDDQMWDHDRDADMPMILSPTKWRADVHHKLSGKPTAPIGFGYLYAIKLVDQQLIDQRKRAKIQDFENGENRSGTIAFPCHSTQTIRAKFSHAEMAERLLSLPDEFHPISVCIFWKDFLHGDSLPYENRGIDVVSAGHMFDRNFLLRFHDLCRTFRFATSNEIGSHLFMSAASGCNFFYLDSSPVRWEIPDDELHNCAQQNEMFKYCKQESRKLFGKPLGESDEVQRAFVDHFIGTNFLRTKRQLNQILSQAHRIRRRQESKGWLMRKFPKLSRVQRSVVKRLPWRSADNRAA